jgi:hypothetical protein
MAVDETPLGVCVSITGCINFLDKLQLVTLGGVSVRCGSARVSP